MCTARTARRRRKQALNRFRHLDPMRRPRYKKISASKAANRLRRVVEKQKTIAQRKGASKK